MGLVICKQLLSIGRVVGHLEDESLVILGLGLVISPLVIWTIWCQWSLVVLIFQELFALGVTIGFAGCLFLAAFVWLLLIYKWILSLFQKPKRKCTLKDRFLSVMFQAGVSIPAAVWEYIVEVEAPGNQAGGSYAGALNKDRSFRKKKSVRINENVTSIWPEGTRGNDKVVLGHASRLTVIKEEPLSPKSPIRGVSTRSRSAGATVSRTQRSGRKRSSRSN